MKLFKISIAVVTTLAMATNVQATLKNDKITLKGNMVVKYNKPAKAVDTLQEVFSEGTFYGRVRTNTFYWDWQGDSGTDNKAMGIGASMIYKTASLEGFSSTLGLYTSQNPAWFREDVNDVGIVKAGKDTFSRYDTSKTGDYGMSVLGQAYLQYDVGKTSFVAGRQMFESVFTKSNDTKMIPNTFDGISATIKDIDKTTIKLAYFAKQKLRDHTEAHDVIAFESNDKWSQNDDSAVNKSLTVDMIGNDNALILATLTNKSIKNLKVNVSLAMVPDVISNVVLEAHYTIPVGAGFKVVPGVRYMHQMDNLNSSTPVASLKGSTKTTGYKDINSLDSNLIALRLDIKNSAFLGRIGYSYIADEADIVAPWRGFPTGGFTRAMAQYNWYANTTTYMIRAGYDFSKADLIEGFSIMARYAVQNFDDKKTAVQADSNIIHIDARQNIGKNLEAKLRLLSSSSVEATLTLIR